MNSTDIGLPAWFRYAIALGIWLIALPVQVWLSGRYQPRATCRRVIYWPLRAGFMALMLLGGTAFWTGEVWRFVPFSVGAVLLVLALLDMWQMAYLTGERAGKWLATFVTLVVVVGVTVAVVFGN